MNVYFLVEGKRTERKVYPQWLSVLVPELARVDAADTVSENNYYLFSGEGFPSILDHLKNAVEEVNTIGKYDYLVVCLDAEETSCEERKTEILNFLSKEKATLLHAKLLVIIQNPCFETWFLGNRAIFKRNPQNNTLQRYIEFYNVRTNDPELMPSYNKDSTKAQFHTNYLRKMFEERGIGYTKKNPGDAGKPHFLQELIKRNEETNHIPSFKSFMDFCCLIKG
ncbi:hypothetical protein EZS27_022077 [termite gut metagenome]|uniref:DUF4276 family protein n=1 Tax=termite gut metagenome TaxID=433724 RepID=A0A5J4R657_9ZZZZ